MQLATLVFNIKSDLPPSIVSEPLYIYIYIYIYSLYIYIYIYRMNNMAYLLITIIYLLLIINYILFYYTLYIILLFSFRKTYMKYIYT